MPYFDWTGSTKYEPRCQWDSDDSDSDDDDCTEDGFSSEIADDAPPTADLTTEAGRREVQLDLRERLWVIEQRVRQLGDDHGIRAYEDDDLEIFDIPVRRLPDLGLDETAPFDPHPLFFHPFPGPTEPAAFREFIRVKADDEERGSSWTSPCEKKWTHDGELCAERRFQWFDHRLEWALGKHLQWQNNAKPGSQLCGCRLDEIVKGKGFRATHYYRVEDAAKPHVMLVVMNEERPRVSVGTVQSLLGLPRYRVDQDPFRTPTEPTSTVAASELISACAAMQHRLRHAEFIDHHTIPILVCSVYHKHAARISQFHWDGSSLVIRQSRLLDLNGARGEPTIDALLLLRWLGNTPTGQTKYIDVAHSDEDPVLVNWFLCIAVSSYLQPTAADYAREKVNVIRRSLLTLFFEDSSAITRASIAREWLIRIWYTVDDHVSTILWLEICHDTCALVFSGILRLDSIDEWPSLFGSVAHTSTMRGFWGRFWHRIIYQSFLVPR